MGNRTIRAVITGAICLLAALPALPAHAAFPGANGKFAFVSERDGPNEIYTMNADGTGQTNITNNPADDVEPAWSPDGTKIAFRTNRDGNAEIYVMNADGSGATNLTNNPAGDGWPAWSPDGDKIAFSRGGDAPGIYTMNADGTGQTRIPTATDSFYPFHPAWSPDGTKIAFARDAPFRSSSEIYTMNADGSNETRLTDDYRRDHSPAWSPDGTALAYRKNSECCEPFQPGAIYKVSASGGAEVNLTNNAGDDFNPDWSPDGSKVLFHTVVSGNHEIHTMGLDGTNRTNISNHPAHDSDPTMAPIPFPGGPGYARPKGATPLSVALVPAFRRCNAFNRWHGPPLEYRSCMPFQQSPRITVGTPDANGAAANSSGFVHFSTVAGDPTTPADEADVQIKLDISDVRCTATAPQPPPCDAAENVNHQQDYVGELAGAAVLRITDRYNSPDLTGKATVQEASISFVAPCTTTPSSLIGATCSANTSADALVPGLVREKDRAVWQLGKVLVFDGGPDGDAGTPEDTEVFLTQGLFVP